MDLQLYGLIGFPLGHSFSVPYFTRKFSLEKIEAEYRNFPLEKIGDFGELVRREPRLAGLNVTVPYKQSIIPYLDTLHPTARSIGAVNTIFFCRKEKRLSLLGYNTDVHGFERSLKEHLTPDHRQALVLGTGGSSKAVIFVLRSLGIAFQLVSRVRGEGLLSYDQIDREIMKSHTLIVNTTPLGMYPAVDACPEIPYHAITPGHLLFDLIYNPEMTRFLSLGREKGATIVNGFDMLVYQAEGSWEIWNKKR
jgi:shikimate dehydrogenase